MAATLARRRRAARVGAGRPRTCDRRHRGGVTRPDRLAATVVVAGADGRLAGGPMDARDAPLMPPPRGGACAWHPRAAQLMIGATQFLVLLDSLMVAVALPVIARELHLTTTQLPGWPPPGWSSCMPPARRPTRPPPPGSGVGRLAGHAHTTDQQFPQPQPPRHLLRWSRPAWTWTWRPSRSLRCRITADPPVMPFWQRRNDQGNDPRASKAISLGR
jgi:hypothetical protein